MSHNAPFVKALVYTMSSICTFDHVTSSVTLAEVHTARHLYLSCSNFCNAEMVLCVYRAAISIWRIYRRWLTLFVPVNYCNFYNPFHNCNVTAPTSSGCACVLTLTLTLIRVCVCFLSCQVFIVRLGLTVRVKLTLILTQTHHKCACVFWVVWYYCWPYWSQCNVAQS